MLGQITSNYNSSKIQTLSKLNLPKNISLRHCSPSSSILLDTMMASMESLESVESVPISTTRRPLTLIFGWMLAQDKHLEKYRQLWFRRGFDVLTVKTSPLDLLLPPIGGQVVARNLVKSLSELMSQYNEIVIHAFSVGGYQCGETFIELSKEVENRDIIDSIKGMVMDSMVFTRDAAPGLSRAVTLNPIIQPMIETSINVFLKLFRNISVKHYENTEQMMFNPIVRCPALFLYSKNDLVSNYKTNNKFIDNWIKRGANVRSKCWSKSTHVLHYKDHQLEYERELDSFIKSLKLRNCSL